MPFFIQKRNQNTSAITASLDKKNASLSNVITERRNHNLMNAFSLLALEKSIDGVADRIKRQIYKQLGKTTTCLIFSRVKNVCTYATFLFASYIQICRKSLRNLFTTPSDCGKAVWQCRRKAGLHFGSVSYTRSAHSSCCFKKQSNCMIVADERDCDPSEGGVGRSKISWLRRHGNRA